MRNIMIMNNIKFEELKKKSECAWKRAKAIRRKAEKEKKN